MKTSYFFVPGILLSLLTMVFLWFVGWNFISWADTDDHYGMMMVMGICLLLVAVASGVVTIILRVEKRRLHLYFWD